MHMIQKNREFIDSYSLRRCMVPEVHKTPEEVIDSVKEKMCALYSIVRGFAWYMITRLFQMAELLISPVPSLCRKNQSLKDIKKRP